MWKEFTDNYAVSDEGIVKNIKTGKILAFDTNSKGYYRVNIRKKHYMIHRLVALMFVPNPLNLPQVNHINHNKLDNRAINLEWCTNQYNNQHGFLHGRISGRTKLSKGAVIHILDSLKDKSISVKNLAELYNVAVPTIYAIKYGYNMKRLNL
jgi:hydroxymethylpyrimidine pyrophosphatase-like HAD family hydrolase